MGFAVRLPEADTTVGFQGETTLPCCQEREYVAEGVCMEEHEVTLYERVV